MQIGKVKRTIRKEPTFIPVRTKPLPNEQPADKPKPIYVPNWPTKKPAEIPSEK